MRYVTIFEYDGKNGKVEIGQGKFHAWGMDYEEFETGPGMFSVAIVEKDNGEVLSVPVELIRFCVVGGEW